jgi:hypothetical protein
MNPFKINEFESLEDAERLLREIHHEFGGEAYYLEDSDTYHIHGIDRSNGFTLVWIDYDEDREVYFIQTSSQFSHDGENVVWNADDIESFIVAYNMKMILSKKM